MNVHSKYQTMKGSTRRLVIAGLAGMMLLGSVGCEDSKKVVEVANNQPVDQPDTTSNDPDDDEIDGIEQPGEDPDLAISDDENVVIEAGYMNGSWQVSAGEQDEPAVRFDTFQDEGSPEVTGDYTMGFAIYELLDGETGEIDEASFDGTKLTLYWNPTTDRDETLTLEANKVDENTLEGTITAKRNVELNLPVVVKRVNLD